MNYRPCVPRSGGFGAALSLPGVSCCGSVFELGRTALFGAEDPAQSTIPSSFAGEVVTDLKHRPEGIRAEPRVKVNLIKMYDKQGTVLRIETTINDLSDFKAYGTKESDMDGPPFRVPPRKGSVSAAVPVQRTQRACCQGTVHPVYPPPFTGLGACSD